MLVIRIRCDAIEQLRQGVVLNTLSVRRDVPLAEALADPFIADDGSLPEVVRPYEAEIREQAERPGEILAQAALLWRLLYNAVDGYRERHPDWVYLRHEDASAEPVTTFERLYDRLGLELTPSAREAIAKASAPDNPAELPTPHAVELDSAASLGRWREQLTPDEVETLRERTRDVWPRFYSDDDW